MQRLPILGAAAVVAAGALASVPAVLGLAGNPSFSQQVPVRPPQHARVLQLHQSQPSAAIPSATARAVTIATASPTARTGSDDRPRRRDDRSIAPSRGSTAASRGREAEPGDDRGSDRNRDRDQHGGDNNAGHHGEDNGGRQGHDDG